MNRAGSDRKKKKRIIAAAAEIADKLEHSGYIYVAGGSTFFLLQEMNRSG